MTDQNAIPKQAPEDALHITVATVSGMDYLLTWNVKHIADAAMRANVELVCRLNGYEPLFADSIPGSVTIHPTSTHTSTLEHVVGLPNCQFNISR